MVWQKTLNSQKCLPPTQKSHVKMRLGKAFALKNLILH